MSKLLALSWVAFLSVSIWAQPPRGSYLIRGKIIENESENPLEYVNVVVYSKQDSALVTGTITNSDGFFEINVKRPGKFFMSVDFMGYEKRYVDDVLLRPGNEVYNAGFIGIKSAPTGIDEVEVVAERPFMTYKIDKKVVDVSKNPSAQGGTAVDALENVPSIQTDIEGNVSVRGSSEFTVLIDGRQSPLSGSDALNQIPASAIDKIEIITNPSVKYDPDGTAGIINVITKKGKLKGHSIVANASLGSSPMLAADINYSYRMKKANVFAGVGFRDFKMGFHTFNDRYTTDSLNQTTNIYTDRNGEMKRSIATLKGGIDYFLSEKNTISVSLAMNNFGFSRGFDSQISTSNPGNSISYELSATDFGVKPKTWQLNVGDKQIFGNNADHYVKMEFLFQKRKNRTDDFLNRHTANGNWEIQEAILSDIKALTLEEANHIRLELEYSLPVSDALMIETGYTMRMENKNQDYSRFFIEDEDWVRNTEFEDESDYSRSINAVWALGKGQFKGIGYSLGLRGEHTNRTIETQKEAKRHTYNYLGWYPSFALSKEWKKGSQLQGSYSKRINRPRHYHLNPFPGLTDGYSAFVPNPELEPEYASSVELNYQKSWGRQYIAIETFYRYTDNEIERVFLTQSDSLLVRTMTNLGNDQRLGGELGGNLNLTKWWSVNPVVTVYYYMLDGIYNDVQTNKNSTNSRASLINNFTLSTKTRIQLMGYYRGPTVTLDGERSETYWTSAAIRQEFLDRKLSTVIRVDDIFSTRKRVNRTISENTVIFSEGKRKSPMFVLSLSYRFNQIDKARNRRPGEENGNGGGMEMEF